MSGQGNQLCARAPAKVAQGVRRGGYVQIVIRLDEETFEQVRERAVAEKRSWGAAVRDLIEWGLAA